MLEKNCSWDFFYFFFKFLMYQVFYRINTDMAFAPRNPVCFTVLTWNEERIESGHLNHILASILLFSWLANSVFFEEKKSVMPFIFLSLAKQQIHEYFKNIYMKIASRYEGC